MHRIAASSLGLAVALTCAAGTAHAQAEMTRSVAGGGVSVAGWTGKVDPGSSQTLADAKLANDGDALHVTTGPAVTYWRGEY